MTTTEIGGFLVELNSCMYNAEKTINYEDFKKLSQLKEDIKKLLNGRKQKDIKNKEELSRLDELEKEEKKHREMMTDVYRKDVPSMIIATTMDMEFAHIGGYDGELIYQHDKDSDKYFYNKDSRRAYLSDDNALIFQTWSRQVSDIGAAATSNPLRLLPMFSYDPRRYRLPNQELPGDKGCKAWNEPFSRMVGSGQKEGRSVWLGFCMNPALGFRPFDELCEHLPKFYEKCVQEDIPILANCAPGGITAHDAKHYMYKRYTLLEKYEKSNDSSMYRGTENVVDDITLNHFYMNHGHPRNWIPVLEHCPGLRLCLSGFGGNSEWQLANWDGAGDDAQAPTREWLRCVIKLAAKYKNVYVDISGLNIYDKGIRKELMKMLDLVQNNENDKFKHLKHKMIFGSGWHLTSLTEMHYGGTGVYYEDIRHSYSNYCHEFKKLFYRADKGKKGELWERVSLINPWNFYALSEDKINKIHDELASIDDIMRINLGLLKRTKDALVGLDDDVEGLVKHISRRNETDPPYESWKLGDGDKDLAPLELEVLGAGVVEEEQITEMYWTYGEDFTDLGNMKDICMSKYFDDLNFHVETKPGNDGKMVKATIERDGQKVILEGIVSENKVVFEKAFE
jgi:hypothetical protein